MIIVYTYDCSYECQACIRTFLCTINAERAAKGHNQTEHDSKLKLLVMP